MMKWFKKISLIFVIFLIFYGCAEKERLDEIQNTQKEILAKLNEIEKKLTTLSPQRRPTVDYNRVYQIPIGDSAIRGNKDAPVTIVEFSDFQCPYCAMLQPTLKEVLKAYPNEVKLVYKHYPLSFHRQARNAAKASEAAREQGKFWEMHDIIFENYNKLSEESFKEFAMEIGLDVDKFMADFKSNKYDLRIQQDINLARRIGITGTPTLFINGKRMMRRSFYDFKTAIDNILKTKK
jgi:protein-disulfide isomerase